MSTNPLDKLPVFEKKADKILEQSTKIADAITKQMDEQKKRHEFFKSMKNPPKSDLDNWTKIELPSGEVLLPEVKAKLKEKNIKFQEEEVVFETYPAIFANEVSLSW